MIDQNSQHFIRQRFDFEKCFKTPENKTPKNIAYSIRQNRF